jgi:hypothetical protein
MGDEMQAMDAGDIELERRLDSYARARLAPDGRAIARIRARVMREARLQDEAARIAAYVAPAIGHRHRGIVRRVIVPFLAASIWLAIAVGTMAAAKAGGPLYPTRLWLESVTVPASGGQRVESDLQRLDDRIAEALGAANSGDREAVAAALDAYGGIARDATVSSADDATLIARVERALARHQAVLSALVTGLTDHGDGTAVDAIQRNLARVIASNAAVLEVFGRQHGAGAPDGAKPGNTSGGASSGTSSGGTGAGAGPAVVTTTSAPGGPTDAAGGGNGGGDANGAGNGGGGGGTVGGSNGGGPTKTADPATPQPTEPDHSPRNGG